MFTPLPAPANPNRLPRRDLWATYYYIHAANAIPPTLPGIDLTGARNRPLGFRLSERDYCHAAIEGTAVVRGTDGRVETLNFLDARAPGLLCDCRRFAPTVGEAVGRTRFRPARGRFGDGAGSYALVPFRTIAVDRELIPLGTALFIPAAAGAPFVLPDGTRAVHDGYFFAADVGGSVRGNHIDVFQATLRDRPFAPFITSSARSPFEARVVSTAEVVEALRSAHTLNAV